MLDPKQFHQTLTQSGISFFTGVPDSLLKDFCAFITDHAAPHQHVIAANEGGAVGLAAGYHLATGKFALVYMQNSGFGNCVNPLTSLTDPDVYGIPMLLVVGWRGEPGKKDEPQHVKMGKVQVGLLEALGLAYAVLPDDAEGAAAAVGKAVETIRKTLAPYALLVKAGTFDRYQLQKQAAAPYPLGREEAIGALAERLGPEATVVCTTGMPSRELFEHRGRLGQDRASDFLTVGSMGHASQIALGVALHQPERPVYCLDGDGAMLMHLGGLSTIGSLAPTNYRHVVLNNGAHDSVGGQPTVGFAVDFCAIARACGYRSAVKVESKEELLRALDGFASAPGPSLLEVRLKTGARADVGRPTATPREAKEQFAARLRPR